MTGETGYVPECRAQYKELQRVGLSPLDLYGWDALIMLEETTRAAKRIGMKPAHSKLFKAFRKQLWDVLVRKAEDIQATTGDDSYADYIEELRREIKHANA